jgi:hypothetical protein
MLGGIARRHRADWILLLYPITHFLMQGNQRMVFARFILPAVPFLAIFAAYVVDRVASGLARRPGCTRVAHPVLALLVAGVLAWPAASSLRTDYLLTQTDTRDQALAWVTLHVPPGSRVMREWHTPCLVSYDRLCPGHDRPVYDAELIPRAGLGTHALSYYRERGVEYLIVSSYVYNVPFYDIDRERLRVEFYAIYRSRRCWWLPSGRDDVERPEPVTWATWRSGRSPGSSRSIGRGRS